VAWQEAIATIEQQQLDQHSGSVAVIVNTTAQLLKELENDGG
jgi:hypothetical protein